MEYKVVETFISINGEGQRAGELAVFIRFAGCNLNCSYCDTVWANQRNTVFQSMSGAAITEYIKGSGVTNVTLTGGEPLMQPGMDVLLECIGKLPGIRVEIETNGSVNIEPFTRLSFRPVFTLDYKLPGSGMESQMRVDNYQYLEPKDTVKFVVSNQQDMERARQIIVQHKLQGRCGIYFSPVFGRIEPAEIVSYMMKYKLNQVHMQLQMHKFIWSPDQRGV